MSSRRTIATALAIIATVMTAVLSARAQDAWKGQTFLGDYSNLQERPTKDGKDYFYYAPDLESAAGRYKAVMVDQPEVFISEKSPYRGAKPADLAAIANLVRDAGDSQLEERGYRIATEPGDDVLYLRLAITDLQLVKKKRGILAYTPVGFVISEGVKAVEDFMQKYDILDMALQAEVSDSVSHKVLGAAVIKRGKSADRDKPITFKNLTGAVEEYGARLACRLDNGSVPVDQRIDCTDVIARGSRPKLVTP